MQYLSTSSTSLMGYGFPKADLKWYEHFRDTIEVFQWGFPRGWVRPRTTSLNAQLASGTGNGFIR